MLVLAATKNEERQPSPVSKFWYVDDLAFLKSGRGLDGSACLLIVDIWKKLFR